METVQFTEQNDKDGADEDKRQPPIANKKAKAKGEAHKVWGAAAGQGHSRFER